MQKLHGAFAVVCSADDIKGRILTQHRRELRGKGLIGVDEQNFDLRFHMGLSPLNRGVVRPDTIFRCDDYNLPQIWRNFNIFRAEIFHFLQTQFDELCRKPKKCQIMSKLVK